MLPTYNYIFKKKPFNMGLWLFSIVSFSIYELTSHVMYIPVEGGILATDLKRHCLTVF